ncbi:FmdB family zinc ribbon protein [Thauera sp. WH-1]|uniref:FmdB family zinc ribbon protein n=1 Tax=Thauera sp. WH-1 TaxID=3398230 RepID=UPI0039FCAA10
MPIYEYRCPSCGFQKEHLQKMSDQPLSSCPSCGSTGYAKLLSAAGFQLKGSGWYATDFKGGGSSTAAPSPSTATPSAPACAGGGCACH